MNGNDTTEFFVHIPFHFIHFLVGDIDVCIRGDFCVEGYDLTAGAVVVYDYVVDTDNVRIFLGKLIDFLDEIGVGRRAEQKVDRFLCRFAAGKENERRNHNPRPTVDGEFPHSRDDRGNEYEGGGNAVAQAIECRRFDCRGTDNLADFAVEEEQPNFDEYRAAKDNQSNVADGGELGIENFVDGRGQKLEPDQNNQHIHDKASDVFQSAVAQGVFLVDGFVGEAEADKGYHGRARVRDIIERVRDNGNRAREDTEGEFADKEQDVQGNPRKPCQVGVFAAGLRLIRVFVFADKKANKEIGHGYIFQIN